MMYGYTGYSFLGATADKYTAESHPQLFDHTKYPDARTGWHWNSTLQRWSLGTGPNDPLPGMFGGGGGGGGMLLYAGVAAAAYFLFFRKRR